MAKNKAITIARTETLAAGNAAAKERYKSAGIDKVEWVSAYDDRICEECESLHGNVYPIGDTPDIPVHPNCRCTLIPYIEKEE
jgi:SPP1 gp7 family putative phage head morphogenesis protein